MIDLNASQAAIRSGYSVKAAAAVASRLLTVAKVQDAIADATKTRALGAQVTRDRVIQELARVAFGDPRKIMAWNDGGLFLTDSKDLTDDDAAQVAEVGEVLSKAGMAMKIKRFDKVKALELLGRHLGMFGDKGGPGDDDNEREDVHVYLPENGR